MRWNLLGPIVGIVALSLVCGAAPAAIVSFPDAGLDAAVREAIAKPEGDIHDTDLVGTGFTSLVANRRNITDLSGLENCTDLTTLSLIDNQISDLGPLASLTELSMLFLKENSIVALGPLTTLYKMHTLSLDDNQIAMLTPLSEMTSLTNLSINRNLVSSLLPLADLASLQELHLSLNAISDVGPLAGLSNLTNLELVSNEITDIGPLLECSGLGEGDVVSLSGNPLSQNTICEQVPVLQSQGVFVTYDGICGIVPGDCNVFWTFATEMNMFATAQGAVFALPEDFREWDLENWPEEPVGDGVPDLWQLGLLADAYCDEHHRLHGAVVDGFQANLDALIADDPDASLNYWTTGMLCLSAESLNAICALRGLDPSRYVPCQEYAKAADEPFSATGDCDGDGESNLEEYEYVRLHGGGAEDYVLAASANSPFWSGNPALPVANSVGLTVTVAGILSLALRRLRTNLRA